MLDVQHIGSVSVIKTRSAMVGDCIAQCRQAISDCFLDRRNQLILDMADSPIVNSEGLELIVDSQESCLSRGGKLVIVDPQPVCKEVLEITGVGEFIAVYEDLRQALSDFAR